MTLEYDKINASMALLKSMRQAYLDGHITADELTAIEVKIKADLRELFGFPPPPTP